MNKRNTIQRMLVLDAVNQLKCHATADEIYQSIIKNHPSIGRGTVYRNLNYLAENNEIRKLEIPGGAERFDHLCHDHYHVQCVKCGKIFDVEMEYIKDLENKIKDTHGFEFIKHDIIFQAICPDCKKTYN